MRKMYEVAQASIADSFTLLIGAAARFASIASLIVNPRFPGLDMTGHQALDRLARWSIDKSEVTEWPGTQLLSTHASIYRYHIDAEFTRELLAIGPSLESWIQPGLPEDPCLLREDGTPVLVTIAHEADLYLELLPEEELAWQSEIPDVWGLLLGSLPPGDPRLTP
jgi:hypothetical protein